VFDGVPAGAALPHASVEGGSAADWSTKTETGREIRTAVVLRERAARAARLHALMAAAEAAIAALPAQLDDGWRVGSVTLLRSRIARSVRDPWAGLIEHRVRVLKQGG
jgi:hypothetical protein